MKLGSMQRLSPMNLELSRRTQLMRHINHRHRLENKQRYNLEEEEAMEVMGEVHMDEEEAVMVEDSGEATMVEDLEGAMVEATVEDLEEVTMVEVLGEATMVAATETVSASGKFNSRYIYIYHKCLCLYIDQGYECGM